MDLASLLHIAVFILLLSLVIAILIRAYGAGISGEEGRRYLYSIAEQQMLPQLIIIGRYVKRLILSWEYLLLVMAIASLALVAAYPLRAEPYYVSIRMREGIEMPSDMVFLYSSEGLKIGEDLSGVVMKIYYPVLEEPIVIQAGNKTFRVFSMIVIDCDKLDRSSSIDQVWKDISGICIDSEKTVHIYPSSLYSGSNYLPSIIYYGNNSFNVFLGRFPVGVLEKVSMVACVGEVLNDVFKQIVYSGGIVTSPKLIEKSIDLGSPNIVIIKIGSREIMNIISNKTLSSFNVEIACYKEHSSGEVIQYRRVSEEGNEYIYSFTAGIASSFFLILFNRSYMLRVSLSSSAILISGGTAWLSSILPLVSLAFTELLAIMIYVALYEIGRIFIFQGSKAFISPLGVLLISFTSLLGSVIHMQIVRSRFEPASTYIEKLIPTKSYSYFVEGYSPRDLASAILKYLERTEFFDIAEKEILEKGDRVNARLRLIYRYSIGVGADVNIYISTHNNGSFLDVDIEPWSIDAGEGGVLDSVSRLILSRISGGIAVDKVSRDSRNI
jgi:hypothetical protein